MKRGLVALAVVAVLMAQAAPALAIDLGEYLSRAADAEFSGEVLVVCDTPDGTVAQFLEVARTDGRLWVRTRIGEQEAIAGYGELYQRAPDGKVQATRVDSVAGWELSARYRALEQGMTTALQRPARVVAVMEDGFERATLHFDEATGALLRSEVRNGDRSLYCSSSFVSFSETPALADRSVEAAPSETVELLDLEDFDEEMLPAQVADFRRLDVYEGPQRSVVAYYSDGVFSFTVISSRRAVKVPELEHAPTIALDGGEYRRLFRPGQVVYTWESRLGGYALIGDLPLDLQEAVLADLPRPGRPGFFVRLWRSWFG